MWGFAREGPRGEYCQGEEYIQTERGLARDRTRGSYSQWDRWTGTTRLFVFDRTKIGYRQIKGWRRLCWGKATNGASNGHTRRKGWALAQRGSMTGGTWADNGQSEGWQRWRWEMTTVSERYYHFWGVRWPQWKRVEGTAWARCDTVGMRCGLDFGVMWSRPGRLLATVRDIEWTHGGASCCSIIPIKGRSSGVVWCHCRLTCSCAIASSLVSFCTKHVLARVTVVQSCRGLACVGTDHVSLMSFWMFVRLPRSWNFIVISDVRAGAQSWVIFGTAPS